MIQVTGIPMGSNPPPIFAYLALSQKEANWVKAQPKLGTVNVQKINNSFQLMTCYHQMLTVTFEKH